MGAMSYTTCETRKKASGEETRRMVFCKCCLFNTRIHVRLRFMQHRVYRFIIYTPVVAYVSRHRRRYTYTLCEGRPLPLPPSL